MELHKSSYGTQQIDSWCPIIELNCTDPYIIMVLHNSAGIVELQNWLVYIHSWFTEPLIWLMDLIIRLEEPDN